jgi:hypothetical protein
MTYDDDRQGWALLIYLIAIGEMFQEIDGYVQDTPDGKPGWSLFVDVDRCPEKGLRWLGQFVGVTVDPKQSGETSEQFVLRARAQIKDASGWKRGRPDSFRGAARLYLTGTKAVLIRERDNSPYNITVVTRVEETPDEAAVLRALLTQKPAGLTLNYIVQSTQTWRTLRDGPPHARTWQTVKTDYATWRAARDFEPPL